MIFLKLALLIFLLKARDSLGPRYCAFIYAFPVLFLGLVSLQSESSPAQDFESPFMAIIILTLIFFLVSWLYFWLLDRLEGSVWWWVVLFGGGFLLIV